MVTTRTTKGSSGKTLYRVNIDNEQIYWLKLYPEQRKFTQELKAYKILKEHSIANSPNLVGYLNTPPYTLILTECKGDNCSEQIFEKTENTDMIFFQAGEFLKRLHQITPPTIDSLTPLNAIIKRFNTIKNANIKEQSISGELITRVESEITRLADYECCLGRSFCHRDYTPRNWHYIQNNTEGIFSVIDFEHSLFDISLLDLTKLNAHYFPKDTKARAAFYKGYYSNEKQSEEVKEALDILTLFYGLQTLAWGYKYSDEEYIELGKEALQIAE